jgi:hypothetical protein
MRWQDTVASRCRYGENAGRIWGDWEIIWEESMDDYQGYAKFLAKKDKKYCFYEWSYGSCSGCDAWEDRGLNDAQIEDEMREEAMWFDDEFRSKEHLANWCRMMEETSRNYNPTLIEAMKAEVNENETSNGA